MNDSFCNTVRNYGHTVTYVSARADEDRFAPFAFTTGLYHTYGHPEVILFGFAYETAVATSNYVAELIAEGSRFEDSSVTDRIFAGGYDAAFRRVKLANYSEYLGTAIGFYGHTDFPVVQLFATDKANRFPWHPAYDDNMKRLQPLLY